MFPYDPALLAAVRTPPQSVADVLRIMQVIEATCADGDGLKWFNWLYLQVTGAVEARIDSGGFSDAAWLAELDVQFARLYFTALNSTLDSLVELAKKTLNVRLLGDPLPPVSRLEDTIAAWSVLSAREAAWQNSELLWHLQSVPPLASNFMNGLDGLTTVAGKTLLVP